MEIVKGHDGLLAIASLDEAETEWWRTIIGKCRAQTIPSPEKLVGNYFKQLKENGNYPECVKSTSAFIRKVRDETWQTNTEVELEFYKKVVVRLFNERPQIRDVLEPLLNQETVERLGNNVSMEKRLEAISGLFGDFTGRVFPYFYELSKSVTQSRRSRAGKVFEMIIAEIMEAYGYTYDSQSRIGRKTFEQKGLGKIVDGILPSMDSYSQNRAKCLVITMKTTLRERWQEVVEELERTKIPSIHLLTLDEGITEPALDIMKNHNITLVTYDDIKQLYPGHTNIVSFDNFFNNEVPHVLRWWASQ